MSSFPNLADAITQVDSMSSLGSGPVLMPSIPGVSSFDLDDQEAHDLLTGGATSSSGIRVNETSSLTHPAVWQAVTMIAGDVAGLPLEVFQESDEGDREKMRKDPLFNVVRWSPNDEMNAFRFWKRMIAWKLLWGNSYAWIDRRPDGTAASMVPLLPDRTAPERVGGQLIYTTEVAGKLRPILAEDVFHLEGLAIDSIAGRRVIQSARTAIGLALAELDFASKFFRNGGRVGGILELPTATSKVARDKLEEGFRKTYGSNEAFRTIVLRDNAKFHQAQVSPQDAQVVEARQESVRDIARLFNIRPGKLGEESRTSFASKSEDNRDYYDTTLLPHLNEIIQEGREKLLSPRQKDLGFFLEHDTRQLLKMDFASMSSSLVSLRSAEVINSDEARRMINLNKREDGKGNEYRNPNINPTKSAGDSADEGPSEEVINSFRLILSSAIDRMSSLIGDRATQKAGSPGKFLSWIDDRFDEQAKPLEEAIREVLDSVAAVADTADEEETRQVVADLLGEAKQCLETIAGSTLEEDLKSVVGATMKEWSAETGDRYAKRLIGGRDSG